MGINREKRKYLLKFESFTYVRDESLLDTASEYEGTDTADEEEEESTSDFEDDSDNESEGAGLQGESEDVVSDEKSESESKTPEGEVVCIGGAKIRDVQKGLKKVNNANPT